MQHQFRPARQLSVSKYTLVDGPIYFKFSTYRNKVKDLPIDLPPHMIMRDCFQFFFLRGRKTFGVSIWVDMFHCLFDFLFSPFHVGKYRGFSLFPFVVSLFVCPNVPELVPKLKAAKVQKFFGECYFKVSVVGILHYVREQLQC